MRTLTITCALLFSVVIGASCTQDFDQFEPPPGTNGTGGGSTSSSSGMASSSGIGGGGGGVDCGPMGPCPADATCVNDVCVCPDGLVRCGDVCADLSADPAHCGSCDISCGAGMCTSGVCSCAAGQTECGGMMCVDTMTDPMNCGACGNDCDPTYGSCSGGDCGCTIAGLTTCGMNDTCVNMDADPRNCGQCTNGCGRDEVCSQGTCICGPGLTLDAGNCVDLMNDPDNCGVVGKTCNGMTARCENGVCVADCTGMNDSCGNACVDTQTNRFHCGQCGNDCNNDEFCVAGQCQKWRLAHGCTMCPCPTACTGGFATCCPAPGQPNVITCVEGDACPM